MTSPTGKSVLMVGNLLSSTVGNRAATEEMAARLAARGWLVHAVSTRRGRLPRLADMLWASWRLRKRYRVAQVDVFSGPAFFWAEAVCAVLRLLGKPYALVLRGGNLPAYARLWPRRVTRLLGSAEAVAAPSSYLVEELSPSRSGIRLIPNAIDTAAYPFRLRARPAPWLVWLRSFHKIYNPVMAVEVLAIVARDYPEARLLMVGPDKGDGSFQRTVEAARRLGVSPRVQFTGAVPKSEIAFWIDRGDIFLNTTDVDNTPVSVIEAMACGACVVTTNVGGLPHLLEDGADALLVPPREPHAMAAAVRRLLREPDLAERLSSHARGKAERFDWSAVMGEWEAVLSLLGGRSMPACASPVRGFQG